MKLLFTFLLSFAFTISFAQSPIPYINTSWSAIDSIKTNILSLIASNYHFTKKVINEESGIAYLFFSNNETSDRALSVTVNKGFLGIDKDMGVKPLPIVRQVILEGLFVDLFPIYQKLFKPVETMDEVKQKGYISFNLKQDKATYIVSLVREVDKWELNIRLY